jgi:hypothetical protein
MASIPVIVWQIIVVVVSAIYQQQQAAAARQRMEEAARVAAEARKGFETVTEATVVSLPIVYGKALVGGSRVYHATAGNFRYIQSQYDKSFNVGPDAVAGSSYTSYVPVTDPVTGDVTQTSVTTNVPAIPAGSFVADIEGTHNEMLFYQQALCIGPIQSCQDVIINGNMTINSELISSYNTTRTADGIEGVWTFNYQHQRQIKAAFRTDVHFNGGADKLFAYNCPDRSSATFTGLAYASTYIRLDRDNPQFNAIPSVQYMIEGRKVRTSSNGVLSSTLVYSNNPAWCLLDYLLDANYGRGLKTSEVNLSSFESAAAVCDKVVIQNAPVGGYFYQPSDKSRDVHTRNIPLFECNVMLDTEKAVRDNVKTLVETMPGASLTWVQGQYKLNLQYPVASESPVLAAVLTDDDIVLGSQVDITWPSAATRLNNCTVRFHDESGSFKEASASWPPKRTETRFIGGGGKFYQPASDAGTGGWTSPTMQYAVWEGPSYQGNCTLTYKLAVRVSGAYTLKIAADDIGSLSIDGVGQFAVVNPPDGRRSWQSGILNGAYQDYATTYTVNLNANQVYTITVSGNNNLDGNNSSVVNNASGKNVPGDSSTYVNANPAGVAAILSLASNGNVVWTTRSVAYSDLRLLPVTDTIYQQLLTEDNGSQLERDTFQDGITDYYHALAMAEESVRTSRTAFTVKFEYVLKDRYLEPGDFISLTSSDLNLANAVLRVNEVTLKEGASCEVVATRFDWTQLSWNVDDNKWLSPTNPFVGNALPAPVYLNYTLKVGGDSLPSDSAGRLDWNKVSDVRVVEYKLYFHEISNVDASGQPVFEEIYRTSNNSYILPNMGAVVGVFGVRSVSGTGAVSAMTVSSSKGASLWYDPTAVVLLTCEPPTISIMADITGSVTSTAYAAAKTAITVTRNGADETHLWTVRSSATTGVAGEILKTSAGTYYHVTSFDSTLQTATVPLIATRDGFMSVQGSVSLQKVLGVTSACAGAENPTKPASVSASGAMGVIVLTWPSVVYKKHGYTEIWASTTNDFKTAQYAGQTSGAYFNYVAPITSTAPTASGVATGAASGNISGGSVAVTAALPATVTAPIALGTTTVYFWLRNVSACNLGASAWSDVVTGVTDPSVDTIGTVMTNNAAYFVNLLGLNTAVKLLTDLDATIGGIIGSANRTQEAGKTLYDSVTTVTNKVTDPTTGLSNTYKLANGASVVLGDASLGLVKTVNDINYSITNSSGAVNSSIKSLQDTIGTTTASGSVLYRINNIETTFTSPTALTSYVTNSTLNTAISNEAGSISQAMSQLVAGMGLVAHTCVINGSVDSTKTTQSACTTAGGVWTADTTGTCYINGSVDSTKTTQSTCTTAGGVWKPSVSSTIQQTADARVGYCQMTTVATTTTPATTYIDWSATKDTCTGTWVKDPVTSLQNSMSITNGLTSYSFSQAASLIGSLGYAYTVKLASSTGAVTGFGMYSGGTTNDKSLIVFNADNFYIANNTTAAATLAGGTSLAKDATTLPFAIQKDADDVTRLYMQNAYIKSAQIVDLKTNNITLQQAISNQGVTALSSGNIQTSNFVPGSAGWQIKYDGTAEFSNLTVRTGNISANAVTRFASATGGSVAPNGVYSRLLSVAISAGALGMNVVGAFSGRAAYSSGTKKIGYVVLRSSSEIPSAITFPFKDTTIDISQLLYLDQTTNTLKYQYDTTSVFDTKAMSAYTDLPSFSFMSGQESAKTWYYSAWAYAEDGTVAITTSTVNLLGRML